MHSKNKLQSKTWIEISKKSLKNNLQIFQNIVGKNCQVCPVVKANAYGHGLAEVSKILKSLGVKNFAVDNINEALILRDQKFSGRIIVLGYVRLEELKTAIENNISFVVYNTETIKRILNLNLNRKALIHLKCETGLNRQGLEKENLLRLAKLANRNQDSIIIEGISTHFANIEDTLDPSFHQSQLEKFIESIDLLKRNGIDPELKHCSATSGTLLYKNTHFNLVRIGIGLYGLWPSRETKIALQTKKINLNLEPAMCWKSIIVQTKTIQIGESVGYGRAWYANRDSKIAIVPIGYSDGFDRKLSNSGRVLIKGHYASVVGRVAMNMIVIDITDISKVKLEDEVILIGKSKNNDITAEEISDKIDTINYEVVARLNPLIQKIIV